MPPVNLHPTEDFSLESAFGSFISKKFICKTGLRGECVYVLHNYDACGDMQMDSYF